MQLTVIYFLKIFPRKINFTFKFGHLPRQAVTWKLSRAPSNELQSAPSAAGAWGTENGAGVTLEYVKLNVE